jgi:glucose-1-phosphate thymidylyltransferase
MRAAAATEEALSRAQAAAADEGLKGMIPFGRPFLDHVLHSLAGAGIREVGLVLGPEHDTVREYYSRLETRRLTISFVTQTEPLGTANAILSAREWAGNDPFLTLNADNLYPVEVLRELASRRACALPGFEPASLGLSDDRLGAFALVEHDANGWLTRLIEKPGAETIRRRGEAALISMNVWRFDDRIFDACRDVPLSSRNERELPDAVNLAVARGVRFEVFRAQGPVLDLSRRADIGLVARQLEGAVVNL